MYYPDPDLTDEERLSFAQAERRLKHRLFLISCLAVSVLGAALI